MRPKPPRRSSSRIGQIEVARLTRELNEALEQQRATAEVLSAISRSNFELQPILQSVVDTASQLCRADVSVIFRLEGGVYRFAAGYSLDPAYLEHERRTPISPGPGTIVGRAAMSREVVQIEDAWTDPLYEQKAAVKISGGRSMIGVPLMREGETIGVMGLARTRVDPFAQREIDLVTTFADQAVIAIENARLFEAEQQRTRELTESLEQQTATSDVLKVISRSAFDLQTVLDTLIESAARLCDADQGTITRQVDGTFYRAATHGFSADFTEQVRNLPVQLDRSSASGRALIEGQIVHILDVQADADYTFDEALKLGGFRTALGVPMLREGVPIGVLALTRKDVRPFTDKQIELFSTFADQAAIAIENVRLFEAEQQRTRELTESLEQQTATSEVLQVISSSPGDLHPVFAAMLEKAVRICDAKFGNIYRWDGEAFHLVATHNTPPAFAEARTRSPMRPTSDNLLSRMVETKAAIHLADVAERRGLEQSEEYATAVELGGVRTVLAVPMLKDNELIGSFTVYRQEVRPFTEKQIALVTNFAAQAVIAIENTRLLNELRQRTADLSQRTVDLTESLEQQTATAEVLQVISSSPGDLQPVFTSMLENAVRICNAKFGNIHRWDGNALHLMATHNTPSAFAEYRGHSPWHPKPRNAVGRTIATKTVVHVADLAAEEAYTERRDPSYVAAVELGGVRTFLAVPMLKENELIGVFTVYRQEVRPFTDKQIALVTNFAAQAVIAVENARLLNELRQRTDDLSEALEQQTATADVLRVISSSPTDVQPVLDAIVRTAGELCASEYSIMFRLRDGKYHVACANNAGAEWVKYWSEHPISVDRGSVVGRTALERRAVHIPDCLTDPEYTMHEAACLGKQRSMLGVPLLRDGVPIGVIALLRSSTKPFTEKQIELVTTFADQAVIAIENVRLLNELRKSLQQQTATADVLKVISRSTFDLQTVLDTLVESAARLCAADKGTILLQDGDVYRIRAHYGLPREAVQYALLQPLRPDGSSVTGRVALEGKAIHILDVLADPKYRATNYQKAFGFRTLLGVPLMRDGTTIGVFALNRDEVSPFTDKQIELVSTFADQAVIAIENARLLNELRKSLQQQSATADVLKVISRSAFDLQSVLDTLVESAARLCDADSAAIHRPAGNSYPYVASYGYTREYHEYMRGRPIIPGRGTVLGRAVTECKPIQVNDVEADPEYTLRQGQRLGGFRTVLGIPLLREDVPIGVIVLTRNTVRPFTDKQIELATTFADQAAIAIENVRLFEAEQQRTQELARSLEDLRSAQDRLVQTEKLASLGQLTAGIAHEIKNPLNFVNNFSGVSTELIDELRDVLSGISIDHKARTEINELTDTLRGNLDKVVQHGKRADSIVKNMLLHSRQGSGEHRPVDINALVEESLNLAYHGARAEKQGFNITLERSFDPAAGEVDLFPQEITRVLLNLISNGFYAATKRKADPNGGDYEPTLAAATKNLGDRVEIRIRDNGTGIPPEVKEKLFSPFFTTKPAGEGTGLGLSISHDIIVKQHGGSIEVDTQPGAFTEFRIVLPRTGKAL